MKKLICVTLAVFLVVWGAALIRCWGLTRMYYDDFENAWMQNTMLGAMGDFKVLDCDGKTAEVYYIAKDHCSGDVLRFEMQEGKWIETGWSTIWSDTGSASDVIWPYWWHFIYGGF